MAHFELDGQLVTGDVIAGGVVIPYGNLLVWPDSDLAKFGITKHDDAPVSTVPVSVSPLQARKALRAANLKTQVDVFISGLSAEKREEWEYCIEVRRDNALIAAAAASLNLTDAAVDDLFRLAATL